MKLDSRQFSQKAHEALTSLVDELSTLAQEWTRKWAANQASRPSDQDIQDKAIKKTEEYCKKASGLVQGLPAYISTWGLHRLSGDAKKFLGKESEDTKYKGKVYRMFLERLRNRNKIRPES